MGLWLNPRGKSTFGIGICDRCSRKMSLDDLYPDPNFPGLRVCTIDLDVLDPWRLPARQTEDIHLPFTRPDVPIATQPSGIMSEDGNYFVVTQDYDSPQESDKNGWLVP